MLTTRLAHVRLSATFCGGNPPSVMGPRRSARGGSSKRRTSTQRYWTTRTSVSVQNGSPPPRVTSHSISTSFLIGLSHRSLNTTSTTAG
eukprot:583997-Pyramimonas_sp.AAC.1